MERRTIAVACVSMALAAGTCAAEDQAMLQQRMHRAAELTSLDTAEMRPWHLKLSVEPSLSAPGKAGAVEEWWAGPERYRITVTRDGSTETEVRNAEGTFISDGWTTVPELFGRLRRQVVHPMPSEAEINGSKLEDSAETVAGIELECVFPREDMRNAGSGLSPLYWMSCLDKGTAQLRLTVEPGKKQTVRLQLGTFQGRRVGVKIGTMAESKQEADAKLEVLEAMAAGSVDLVAPAGFQKVGEKPTSVPSGVMQGRILKSVPPIYPPQARSRGMSGRVVLNAVIGKDGHMRSVTLMSSPDEEFAAAAAQSVKQWIYTPYLLDGEPVEVSTTIEVNFRIGS